MIVTNHDSPNMQIKIMDRKTSVWTAILLLTIFLEYGSIAKKLNASQAFDNTWHSDVELENELEVRRCQTPTPPKVVRPTHQPKAKGDFQTTENILIQCMLQQKRAKGGSSSGSWSGWSDWSTCSRTCDGGVAQQIRRCHNPNGCKGDTTRFRICNMQPCPEQQDFRAHQCAAYNDVPYDGTLYTWTTHYDYVDPCALTCRGRPAHLSDDVSLPEVDVGGGVTGPDESEHYDEPSVIVQLSARVQDGTRCRAGSLDMCIQGKCQRVGCDLKIGSTKKIDACGVCGGDGKSCSQPLYHWETAPMSLCSVTCGGGYKMSRPTCRNRVSGVEVEDSLCSATNRPEPSVVLCNTHACPPKWIADDEWGPCSRLCGPGYRERMVVCAEETNGIRTRVPDIVCRSPKPPTQESCMVQECPKWEVEEWSGCSVTCGHGIQMRGVECKSTDGSLSAKCDPQTKPPGAQQCTTGLSCNGGDQEMDEQGPDDVSKSDEDDEEVADEEDGGGGEEVDDAEDSEQVSYNDQPIYAHQQSNRLHHEELPPRAQSLVGGGGGGGGGSSEPEHPSSDPTFIKDTEWSACSVTCGEGIRRRPYKCKIFLEYSRTIATVNDSLCEGPKPHDEVERCVEEPCMLPSHGYDEQYPRDSIKVGVSEPGKTYVWREQGYTSCSASCLGGVEELIINCVREDNGRVVSPFLCSPETKPEARVRTCNDRPCPPRWNYSDYTPCSKSCGIGIKTREVQCIHEVTRGGENTMVVPNSMCPQPPPADRQYCNVLDCPVRWEVGEWSKCSHTCGYGIKERKVECKQIMAQEHKIERPESMCPSAKPADKKPCNVKPCPPEDPKPIISISNSTHIQHDPKKSKITLKVGGAAVVFFGTQVKIKCPVKRYNRTKIRWTKDHKPLAKSRKFKVSKKGALRVLDITFRDAGVYSCHAGLSTAEINIEVKAKPGTQPEDYEKHESDRLVRERSGTEPLTSADMTSDVGPQNTQRRQKQQANGRERNRRPKSDGVQHADSSIMEDEYLWPLQKFSNSKGHHLLMEKGLQFGVDLERFEKDEPAKPQIITKELNLDDKTVSANDKNDDDGNDNDNGNDNDDEDDDLSHKERHTLKQLHHHNQILRQGELEKQQRRNTNNITFKWVTSDWSECSEHCGSGTGLRRRTATCVQVTPDDTSTLHDDNSTTKTTATTTTTTVIVDNVECEDAGLNIPDTFESCGNDECPQWKAGEWSICQTARCFGRHTAIQKREVICKYINDTLSDGCDEQEKPISRQECYNELCKGIWRVEPWSECNAPCGRQGLKYRILQCVWYGTRRPAGYECKHQPRPAVMKVCKSPPCSTKARCKDSSRYCKNVRSMGLCRLHRYQEKCCKSCKFNIF
ncbi:protein madd-4-like isoform X4 [Eupeodes corollae]|uniref:protein madd-4-like isoform X4 n=1 Tax=Eupeodes corollae TaxID=290404 RepID=UPI0024931477|nr:protein madd-4-like isoform X4 [Eupeodes corollae]